MLDENDNWPIVTFSSYLNHNRTSGSLSEAHTQSLRLYASENLTARSFLAFVSVRDEDSEQNGRVSCRLLADVTGDHFNLSVRDKGRYSLSLGDDTNLDYEVKQRYKLVVACEDHGVPPRTSRLNISLQVVDENDNTPVFDQSYFREILKENTTSLEKPVITVRATDEDSGVRGEVGYHLEAKASRYFRITPQGGELFTTLTRLDYEMSHTFDFLIFASDGGAPSRTATATVNITLMDINDEAAVFSLDHYVLSVAENQGAGAAVVGVTANVTATDRDSPPLNQFTYNISYTSEETKTFRIRSDTGFIIS